MRKSAELSRLNHFQSSTLHYLETTYYGKDGTDNMHAGRAQRHHNKGRRNRHPNRLCDQREETPKPQEA